MYAESVNNTAGASQMGSPVAGQEKRGPLVWAVGQPLGVGQRDFGEGAHDPRVHLPGAARRYSSSGLPSGMRPSLLDLRVDAGGN
jgi:hypothetical protein